MSNFYKVFCESSWLYADEQARHMTEELVVERTSPIGRLFDMDPLLKQVEFVRENGDVRVYRRLENLDGKPESF